MPAQQLKGKSVGIGGSSDLAARAFLNELKLAPDNDVAILQFGGSTESAAAFDTGRIVVFPAPAGLVYLTQGMPHRIVDSAADFPDSG